MVTPGLTDVRCIVGNPGPKTMGGRIPTTTTSSTDYIPIALWDCVHIPFKRMTLSVFSADVYMRLSGYVDKAQGFKYVIGEAIIKAGDTHIFTADFGITAMLVEIKVVTPGQTATVGGAYSGVTTDSVRASTLAYESLTITNATPVGLTRDLMLSVWTALITVEDNPIRFRLDGVAPTTSEGHLLQAGDMVSIGSTFDALNFLCVATGANAKIRVSYSR